MGTLIDNTGVWETRASKEMKEAASSFMAEAASDHDFIVQTHNAAKLSWTATYGDREITAFEEQDALYEMDVLHDTYGNNYGRYMAAQAREDADRRY